MLSGFKFLSFGKLAVADPGFLKEEGG